MTYKNKVRIIAGKWRGRNIQFPDSDNLRPTGDRIRETLFNWLTPVIMNTRCLDMFAGSGILGFEALSRGAQEVVMIEQNQQAVYSLKKNCDILSAAEQLTILNASIPNVLPSLDKPFDIVFIDPPFLQDLIALSCQWLMDSNLIKPGTYIYVEVKKTWQEISMPKNWHKLKEKTAGNVKFYLFKVEKLCL